MSQFFYSGQIRRFLAQFIRVMSGFTVKFGRNDAGEEIFRAVPATYGDPSRMVAAILRADSANTLLSAPQIACYVTGIKYARDRIQEPNFVNKVNVQLRKRGEDGIYLNEPGDRFTVERLMPVPYDLTVKADVWCSSTDQKLHLLEQVLVLFNPSFEIQSTDNFLDWGSLSLIELQDVVWSGRSVPVGGEEIIDVATLTFEMPIWLSTPAKVKKLGVITNIITQLYDASGQLRTDLLEAGFTDEDFNRPANVVEGGTTLEDLGDPLHANVTAVRTPERTNEGTVEIIQRLVPEPRKDGTSIGYDLIVINGQARLLKESRGGYDEGVGGEIISRNGEPASWEEISYAYGDVVDGLTKLFLRQDYTDNEVVCTIARDESDVSVVSLSVDTDTIPSNSLGAVNNIINPLNKAPSRGLPAPATGQRYLLLEDIGSVKNTDGADAWKGSDNSDLVALRHDIIQWNGTNWIVSFRATGNETVNYVTNSSTGVQFKWTGVEWIRSWEGYYRDGTWRIV
jgi:hypothetical protein